MAENGDSRRLRGRPRGQSPVNAARIAAPRQVNRPLGPDEVVCIFGRRGSGKTYLARRLVAGARRLVVWDPLGEWSRSRDLVAVDGLTGLRAAMRRRWRLGFRLALVPGGAELPRSLHALAAFLWAAQAPYPACPGLALVVDEANLGLPAHRLGADLWGMSRLVLQGRHRGVALLAISQRPALVSMDLRGQAHRLVSFALPAGPDLAAMRPLLGQAAAELPHLPARTFLELSGDGTLRRGTAGGPGRRLALNLASTPPP